MIVFNVNKLNALVGIFLIKIQEVWYWKNDCMLYIYFGSQFLYCSLLSRAILF